MNIEVLSKKIKKIAQEISSLTHDIEHNTARRQFYIDLIKQRVFDLYDLTQEFSQAVKGKEVVKDGYFLKKNQPTGFFRTERDETVKENPIEEKPADITKIVTEQPKAEEKKPEPISIEKPIETPVAKNLFTEEPKVEEKVIIPTQEEVEIPLEDAIEEETVVGTKEDIKEEEIEEEKVNIIEESAPVLSTPATEANKVSLAEKPSGNTNLRPLLTQLLADITARKTLANDISHKLQSAPITNFYNTVSISQKHQYIDELFACKPDVYRSVLQKIEEIGNLQDSLEYLGKEIAPTYHWEKSEKLVSEFLYLVNRRFL
ncbi:MAG: hypothetical protein M0R38_00695 [Bacteroidia bacterium]|nr:hypothetical protein [Bacteroidia bacterium]